MIFFTNWYLLGLNLDERASFEPPPAGAELELDDLVEEGEGEFFSASEGENEQKNSVQKNSRRLDKPNGLDEVPRFKWSETETEENTFGNVPVQEVRKLTVVLYL